jgi:hypothetical protein
MLIRRAAVLDVSADRAWGMVRRSSLLQHVSYPLQVFEPLEPDALPEVWADGGYKVRCRLFGLIPVGEQWINISTLEAGPDRFVLRDDGHGDLAKRWDHRIIIQRLSGERCRYTDEVKVDAGLLTPFVVAFAWIFYRHRQRRWRGLVASGFAPLGLSAPA